MVTPLGTTFSTNEKVVAQGNITFMGKMVESLVVEFDQAMYKEFLSSGSKNRKVSSQICFQVSSETFPRMACANRAIFGRVAFVAYVNVSYETR